MAIRSIEIDATRYSSAEEVAKAKADMLKVYSIILEPAPSKALLDELRDILSDPDSRIDYLANCWVPAPGTNGVMSVSTPFHAAKHNDYLRVMLETGAPVNLHLQGYRPLYSAIAKANAEFAELLLQYGADPHDVGLDGNLSGYQAIGIYFNSRDCKRMADLITRYGADPNQRLPYGKVVPMAYEIRPPHVLETIEGFCESGADLTITSRHCLHEDLTVGDLKLDQPNAPNDTFRLLSSTHTHRSFSQDGLSDASLAYLKQRYAQATGYWAALEAGDKPFETINQAGMVLLCNAGKLRDAFAPAHWRGQEAKAEALILDCPYPHMRNQLVRELVALQSIKTPSPVIEGWNVQSELVIEPHSSYERRA